MMNVSSIIKKGLGYEIELSKTYRILNLFSFISKKKYYCADHGCVESKGYRPIRDRKMELPNDRSTDLWTDPVTLSSKKSGFGGQQTRKSGSACGKAKDLPKTDLQGGSIERYRVNGYLFFLFGGRFFFLNRYKRLPDFIDLLSGFIDAAVIADHKTGKRNFVVRR